MSIRFNKLFFFILCYPTMLLQAQTFHEEFDLDFKKFNACKWEWASSLKNSVLELDTTDNQTLLKFSYTDKHVIDTVMHFKLQQLIILPKGEHAASSLEINTQARVNAKNGVDLIIMAYDENEKIVCADSISSSNGNTWQTLSLKLPARKVRAIHVTITYNGNGNPSQLVALKRVNILADGRQLTGSANHARGEPLSNPINESYIEPLSWADDQLLLAGADLGKTKVFGLGESTHGSKNIKEARFAFLKQLISTHNCKLVLMELPYDVTLLLDAYVQGSISETAKPRIIENLDLTFSGAETLIPFLDWLRLYNADTELKVRVFGVDNASNFFDSAYLLMDYHLEMLGPEYSIPYIELLLNKKRDELLNLAGNDDHFKNLLGSKNFDYYQFVLSDSVSKDNSSVYKNREINMFNRTLFFVLS